MSIESNRTQHIIAWLDKQTDQEAWLKLTYQEIADQISTEDDTVAQSTVRELLAVIMAKRLDTTPSVILKRKKDYRTVARGQMTDDKLQQIKAWRAEDPPVSFTDIAFMLKVSINTVRHHCKKLGIE